MFGKLNLVFRGQVACHIMFALLMSLSGQTFAQFGVPAKQAEQQLTQHWQVGVIITAEGGPCSGLFGTIPVPKDWSEQQVRIADEEITNQVRRVTYRELGGVKQMLFSVPYLRAGDQATALITFEVTRKALGAPSETSQFIIPKKIPRDVRICLGSSPNIESRNREFRDKAREIVDPAESAWRQVESIYDWVRDNIKYQNGRTAGALAAIRNGKGNKHDATSVFIALCRAHKIPARTVFVPDHCYAEFYLGDKDGGGRWIPCMVAGTRDFGQIADMRPVLQKGDNFRVPEVREPQRFVAEFLTGKGGRGAGTPSVEFVRKLLPAQ